MSETDRRIVSTGKGADWYGNCERCGKYCSEHFKQQFKIDGGWGVAGFGHAKCLQTGAYKNTQIVEPHN